MSIFDVTIGAKSLTNDFDFIVSEFYVSPPEPYLVIIPVTGTSDVIDMTESLSGDIEYKQRKISIKTAFAKGKNKAYSQYSKLANYCHGRKMPIVCNRDSGFYWNGRINLDSFEKTFYGGTPIISAIVDPYKYEIQSSMDQWIWDSFSFEDGTIRNYYNIAVPGTITIIGRRKRVCPKFICSGAMTVTYLGNSYNLATGESIVPDIFLGEGSHVLTFSGSGTVSVDYRGASL
ncbi:hypothetical protein [Acetobacterium sp.]|uniref:hypothetical protein n=1 Tax=Acetobacterium sp. TaxID=1872094 RepID=UPI00271B4431|nr:hypothetical protein [Acetobacterium sp.]MDO9492669.1 hypothetical protein [Acetobacterium sp.]